MKWVVRGVSLNGMREYEIAVEAPSLNEARRGARECVTDYIRAEFEGTPAGVGFLMNTLTMHVQKLDIKEEKQT